MAAVERSVTSRQARIAGRLLLFFGSAAAFAVMVAAVTWRYLPYDALERYSPEDRFFVWEAVVWLISLLLAFLGAANILEVVGWRVSRAFKPFVRSFAPGTGDSWVSPAAVPWWMLATAAALITLAVLARRLLHP